MNRTTTQWCDAASADKGKVGVDAEEAKHVSALPCHAATHSLLPHTGTCL